MAGLEQSPINIPPAEYEASQGKLAQNGSRPLRVQGQLIGVERPDGSKVTLSEDVIKLHGTPEGEDK